MNDKSVNELLLRHFGKQFGDLFQSQKINGTFILLSLQAMIVLPNCPSKAQLSNKTIRRKKRSSVEARDLVATATPSALSDLGAID